MFAGVAVAVRRCRRRRPSLSSSAGRSSSPSVCLLLVCRLFCLSARLSVRLFGRPSLCLCVCPPSVLVGRCRFVVVLSPSFRASGRLPWWSWPAVGSAVGGSVVVVVVVVFSSPPPGALGWPLSVASPRLHNLTFVGQVSCYVKGIGQFFIGFLGADTGLPRAAV